jgi:hypothetical protein
LSTTSWTSPNVANPDIIWTLTLNISDRSERTASCSISFSDPDETINPTPTPGFTDNGGDGLGCATHDCSGNKTNNTPQGQVLGASTMAKTGSFEEVLNMVIMSLGGIFTSLGIKKASKKAK